MVRAPDFGRVHEALLLLLSTTRSNFGSSLNLHKQTNKQTKHKTKLLLNRPEIFKSGPTWFCSMQVCSVIPESWIPKIDSINVKSQFSVWPVVNYSSSWVTPLGMDGAKFSQSLWRKSFAADIRACTRVPGDKWVRHSAYRHSNLTKTTIQIHGPPGT